MFKKSLLIGSLAFLAMFGISQPANSSPIAKEFIVGVDDDYPPFDFFDEKGQATGFDVDLIRAIADKQQLALRFVPTHWNNIVENLDNKKIQLALSGFAYSDERAKKYQVSNTYAYGKDAIVTVNGHYTTDNRPKTLEDLKPLQVLTLGNSPYIEELESVKGKGSSSIIGLDNSLSILTELMAGKGQAGLTDKSVAKYYLQTLPNAQLTLTGEGDYFTKYPLVFVAHKDEAELMQKINVGLTQIVQDGTYSQIYKKWFGEIPKDLPAVK